MLMSAINFVRRLVVPSAILLLVVLGSHVPAIAAAPSDTPEQARQRYLAEKIRSWSRSVVQLHLVANDGSVYRGSGAYVTDEAGRLYLITADHVLRDSGGQFGQALVLRPFKSDPDERDGWINIGRVADAVRHAPQLDLAIFRLAVPLPGMIPAQLAEEPARVGDLVLAFGFGSERGRLLAGQIRGAAANAPFLAARLGAAPGDSGGPVFDLRSGKVIGMISSNADSEMSDGFIREIDPTGKVRSRWSTTGRPMGADTLIVHVAAILKD